jgi:hypothetical protein
MRLLSLRRMLVFTAVLYWIVAAIWFITQPDLEPLTALLGALIGLIPLLGSRAASDAPISDALKYSPTPKQRNRNRKAMLQLVKNTWVKGVLEQSLHGAVMIELGLEYRADVVERPWDMVLQTAGQPNYTLPRGTKIVGVFDEMKGALLILGGPGSGKTTMLLELARDLIARAEWDDGQPMPVVFNLSSWAENQQPIVDWLVDELNSKYYISKKVARDWVENDDLVLLLDGLDEVKLEQRDACVQAINDFRKEHGLTPVVVCSRTGDYDVLSTWLRLQGAVVLQPLLPEQVNKYLEGAGVELLAVRQTLRHDTTLQELVQSPLMLSIMALAYRGMSADELGSLDVVEVRRRHVFDAYVQQMFKRRGNSQRYSPEQTTRWLAWLAQKMSQHGQTVFLIERMQPGWLERSVGQRLFVVGSTLTTGLIVALISGLTVGVLFGMAGDLHSGLIAGLIVGGVSGLLLGPAFALTARENINTVEVLQWSWSGARAGLITGLKGGIVAGLLFGLISGLCAMAGATVNVNGEPISVLHAVALCSLGGGLVFGLGVGALLGLTSALIDSEIEATKEPNQGIRQSASNAIIVGLSAPLLAGLVIWLIARHGKGLVLGLGLALIPGMLFGMSFGGLAVIQHFTLRFILYRTGHIPWSYARFLDYAAERIFLRKVGGGYIFIHRLLMEYFAELEA